MRKRKPSVYATMVNELRVTQGALTELHAVLMTIAERLRAGRLELTDATAAITRLTDQVVRLDGTVAAMPETIEVAMGDAIQVEVANVCPKCENTRYAPTGDSFPPAEAA